jgi:fibronectin type 3 domain-containing protein
VKAPEPLDVRIGPTPGGRFDMNACAREAQRIPESEIKRNPPIATVELDAAPFYNKTIVLAARALSPKGSDAGWSNTVIFPVVPALPKPAGVEWTNAPDAVHLTWHAAAPQFRILRRQSGQTDYGIVGTSDKPEYLDTGITYGNTYDYLIQSIEKVTDDQYAESDLTEKAGVKPEDRFAPAVPGGLTAVPGAKSIELVWNRDTDRDFASYRIYRDGKLLASNIVSLAYSDRAVKPGATYTYQLTAVDTTGNESEKSAPVSAALP